MQIKKAGAVAVGALATVAAMGAPAAATTYGHAPTADKAQAMRALGSQFLGGGTARGGWDAPWDQEQQALLSVGTGSALTAASWQACGGVGGWGVIAAGVAASSPNTVVGDCANANIKLSQDTIPGVVSVLSDTAVSVASWQSCGSVIGGGVIAVGAALQSPNTVLGSCDNSNIVITHDHGYNTHHEESASLEEVANATALRKVPAVKAATTRGYNTWGATKAAPAAASRHGGWDAPWDVEPMTFLSVGTGSAAQALSWQVCASTAGMGVIAVAASASSPNTVLSDCNNANVWIDQDDPTALISVLDNSSVNIAPWQVCGSTIGGGVIAAGVSLQSPNTVFGNCNNANVTID
ncbi:hypothetical protein F4553_003322 [Allocatelliglobosispora scoriae]|uniref:Uncharacterized protein n=1 Tax=Allocatelliglobosispora scoriae TaxID=643052 RepID=A0A841BSP6_9ACTN|nr:hypothetical protein [Allocatelliglobosispora scoriae]MBB5869943.1 hypothetical protein [Allocatelliglobosispora scoriae]